MPPRHTFRLFYFPLPPSHSHTTIASLLRSGFETMIQKIPHLAGTVSTLPLPCTATPRGRLAIAPPFHPTTDEIFYIRDLRTRSMSSYDVLRARGFPMDVFAFEDVFTVATDREDWFGLNNPVLLAQVNFIEGGLMLAVGMHHSVLDGKAAVEVMKVWAGCCKEEGEEGEEAAGGLGREGLERGGEEVEGAMTIEDFAEYVYRGGEEEREGAQVGPVERMAKTGGFTWYASSEAVARLLRPLLRHLPEYIFRRPLGFLTHYFSFRRAITLPTTSDPDTLTTSIFLFPSSSLLDLKTTLYPDPASSSSSSSSPPYISTNDALSALCFACMTQARWPSLSSSEEIHLAVTLDGRRLLHPPLADTWMGNAVLHAQIKSPIAKLQPPCIEGLRDLALRLRNRISEIRDGEYAEGLLKALHKVPDLRAVVPSFQAAVSPGGKVCKGMLAGVWTAQHEFYSLDWGFGRCERMRLPKQRFGLYGGASVILPRVGKADTEAGAVIGEKKGEIGGGVDGGDGRVGLCLLLPELRGEGVEVLVGLNRQAMERLRKDELWNRWGRWICD